MRTFSTTDVSISIFNERIFVYEDNYIQITRTNPLITTVTVDGRVYTFYTSVITIEYSDVIASFAADSGTITVDGLAITYVRFFGVSPDSNVILPPNKITVFSGLYGLSTAFYLPIWNDTYPTGLYGVIGGAQSLIATIPAGTFASYSLPTIANYDKLVILLGAITPIYSLERMNEYNINADREYYVWIERGNCGSHYRLLQWRGRNGIMKSYTFEVVGVERSVDNKIELVDGNYKDGINYRKDMGMTLQLIARNVSGCDVEYLSDIVTSSVVVAYDGIRGALEVGVSTSNSSYNQSKNDFEINIETKKYY